MKIVFFATPDFALPCLEYLQTHSQVELCQVVSMPDRPAGRGNRLNSPPVIEFSHKHKIRTLQTANIKTDFPAIESLKKLDADLFIVFAFAQFLSQEILDIPKLGCFNIHTSLLPQFRGAAPIQYALLEGLKRSGVSIQKMVKKMDAGNVVTALETEIHPWDQYASYSTRLKYLAVQALDVFLKDILSGNLSETVQDESKVSFAPTIQKEQGFLDLEELDANQVRNHWRAFYFWPGVSLQTSNHRLKLTELGKVRTDIVITPKSHMVEKDRLIIGCKEHAIEVFKVQPEGKRSMNIKDYLNGLRDGLHFV